MISALMILLSSILLVFSGVISLNNKDYVLAIISFFSSYCNFSVAYKFLFNDTVIIMMTFENTEGLEPGFILHNTDTQQVTTYIMLLEKVSETEYKSRTLRNYEIILTKCRIKIPGAKIC